MRDPTPGGIPRSMPANTLVAVAALAAAQVQTNDSATGSQDAERRLLNVTVSMTTKETDGMKLRRFPIPGAPRRISCFLAASLSLLVASRPARSGSLEDLEPDGGQSASAEENFDNSWVTASSDHFLIYATGGARVARRALEEAERAVQALRVALTTNGPFPDDRRPLTLVLFGYESLYASVAPARTAGLFRPAMSWGETDLILLRGVGRFQILRHELVHRLTLPVLPKAPPWLAEGLAEYFQWTEITETSITVGSTPETVDAQRTLHGSPFFPPLSQLLAIPKSEFYGPQAYGLYSASFWLMSTLNSDAYYRTRFNRVIEAMAQGSPAMVAWSRAFSAAKSRRWSGIIGPRRHGRTRFRIGSPGGRLHRGSRRRVR